MYNKFIFPDSYLTMYASNFYFNKQPLSSLLWLQMFT